MRTSLQDEIRQNKPFPSLREELWLNLSRTYAMLSHELEARMREHGLSLTQYNVLRILRGAPEGLRQFEVRDRLVARVPDVPRILDRMEKNGTIRRVRGVADRRMMIATLTERGLQLVNQLDEPMHGWMEGLFQGLEEAELRTIVDAVARARRTGVAQAE